MRLIASRPSRLYCNACEEVYGLPQGGAIKLYKELSCPLDGFQLLLFSLGGADGKVRRRSCPPAREPTQPGLWGYVVGWAPPHPPPPPPSHPCCCKRACPAEHRALPLLLQPPPRLHGGRGAGGRRRRGRQGRNGLLAVPAPHLPPLGALLTGGHGMHQHVALPPPGPPAPSSLAKAATLPPHPRPGPAAGPHGRCAVPRLRGRQPRHPGARPCGRPRLAPRLLPLFLPGLPAQEPAQRSRRARHVRGGAPAGCRRPGLPPACPEQPHNLRRGTSVPTMRSGARLCCASALTRRCPHSCPLRPCAPPALPGLRVAAAGPGLEEGPLAAGGRRHPAQRLRGV